MSFQIVVLDGFLPNPGDLSWDPIAKHGELTVYSDTAPEDILPRLQEADAVLANRCLLDAGVFQALPRLKYVGTFGTGYYNVDVQAATLAGVTVCNVPDYSTYAVAQAAVALLLEIANRTGAFDRYIKEGRWTSRADPDVAHRRTRELRGMTMGIWGMGNVGSRVAQVANALGMRVLAYRRHPEQGPCGPFSFVDLEELLAESDVISLHCPLTEETRHMVNRGALAKMKPGAILINTARGALINEEALVEALEEGHIAWAGLDVLAQEPPDPHSALARHPRCVVTPHVAWAPRETRQRLLEMMGENLAAYRKGKPIHQVNP